MIALVPLIRRIWIALNLCFAFAALAGAVGEVLPSPTEGLGGALFFLFVAFLFAMVGFGLWTRRRWVVAVSAMPVFLIAAGFTLLIAAGGWIWGPGQAGTMTLLIFGGLAVAAVELIGPFLVHRAHRLPQPPPQEP
jgi:hypothetical protein